MTATASNLNFFENVEESVWEKVNRLYIKKALSEFSHERLLEPLRIGFEEDLGIYQVFSDSSEFTYSFKAKEMRLDHWNISVPSIVKKRGEDELPLLLMEFILEFKTQLQIPETMLETYLEEIASTLYGATFKYSQNKATAQQLAEGDFQLIEKNMIEGHPCFLANSGRIGFDVEDYSHYAPEASSGFKMLWLAGHQSLTTFTAVKELSFEKVMHQEIGSVQYDAFRDQLKSKGLNPEDYFFFPMHPWQWENKLSIIFASDIADKKLILLGEGKDDYQPQQSIRTLFNTTSNDKFYVKTALSIQNMGFLRGLSPYYMKSTPEITTWISNFLKGDEYLKTKGFKMLGEVATLGYTNQYFEAFGSKSAYNKMCAVLWRESPVNMIKAHQTLSTMAGILHIDTEGNALIKSWMDTSGLSACEWVMSYLSAYLSPLLHCFYQHDLAFMPHGENLIMVLENSVPVSVFMKDITEEVVLYEEKDNLPDSVKRLVVKATDEVKSLTIFTDVFDCFFRFLAQILEEHCAFPEDAFWALVAQNIHQYQSEFPELEAKFKASNLFEEEFILSCLNRLQLQNNKQMVDLSDPVNSLQFIGKIKNPIHQFRSYKIPELTA
ncbi:IucA/IucC family siderophore biosynthesis protein [Flammeovirga yaeyamensis]|uniref:IucA/IucC family siderophore biosynthesis protein n=1 Tax=Flammeovirga yaeyamensis TaxID=367791 RepID=A0AAX1N1Q5_9BACT|nr:IucA/IucC family siderophore biosynthesis protein [Flammeovirga yaeyamensis]MBB3698225.1 siderophore synthetase component [Flammeovirga yaeyamensis]NMF34420.1 IucA/IucC family siderophore biosynthesis protein [Flammeovirga yaeyamensis]QWG01399.1 IucA/IucC family siderophore biosynthesis protein [Flammeovirga yaeyamensis]